MVVGRLPVWGVWRLALDGLRWIAVMDWDVRWVRRARSWAVGLGICFGGGRVVKDADGAVDGVGFRGVDWTW